MVATAPLAELTLPKSDAVTLPSAAGPSSPYSSSKADGVKYVVGAHGLARGSAASRALCVVTGGEARRVRSEPS